jgi:hypothetical protein
LVKSIRLLIVASLALASLGLAGAALAQSAEQPPEEEVKDVVIRNDKPGEELLPSLLPRGERRGEEVGAGVLPFTGADLTLFVVLGLAAIGAGTVIVRRARSGGAEA